MKRARTKKQWAADIGAVLSLLLVGLFVALVIRDQRISANPEKAVAWIYEKEMLEGDGEGPTYLVVRYSFTTETGDTFHGSANVGSRLYDRVSVGDGVEIEYAVDDPTMSRVPGEFDEMWVEALAVGVQGVAFFGYLGPRRWLRTWRGEVDPVLMCLANERLRSVDRHEEAADGDGDGGAQQGDRTSGE